MNAYERVEDGQTANYEKIILALLQQCKDEGLSVDQSKFVLNAAGRRIDAAVKSSPVVF